MVTPIVLPALPCDATKERLCTGPTNWAKTIKIVADTMTMVTKQTAEWHEPVCSFAVHGPGWVGWVVVVVALMMWADIQTLQL